MYFISQNTLFGGVLGLRKLRNHVIPIFSKKEIIFCQRYIEHMHLEMFEWFCSSEKLFTKTLHPITTHCCEAPNPILSNYFCITQVYIGTFWEIWRIQIQIYNKTSIEPKYGVFYLKNEVSVPHQSLLVQLSWRVTPPYPLKGFYDMASQTYRSLGCCFFPTNVWF